jgi:hypothetical protein
VGLPATFSSGNTSIATVNSAGSVSGVAPGSTSTNTFVSYSKQKTIDGCTNANQSNSAPTQVQVPTSLSVTIGNKITHNGDSAGICPGPACIPVCYGYERRLTYTVLDQFTPPKPIQNATMSATEVVTKVSSNPSNAGGNFTITVAVGSDGKFGDILAFCAGTPPPPQPGQFIKDKQAITVTLKGVGYPVRTNCADFESNDVTLTDVTGNPGATCQ